MGVFLVELGVLLLALALLGALARRVDLSPIPFFLLAGLGLGEGGIHSVAATEDFVRAAGEIGVLLLLLMLGLEFSAAEFTATLRRHADSGLVDLLLNAPIGFVAGLLLGYEWQACVALAGITWISSSGMVARLLSDLGRMGHRETPAVLSVLVLEDIAMAVYLPLLVVILAGGSPLTAAIAVATALGLVVVVLVSTRMLGHRLARLLGHQEDEQVLLRVLGLMLVVAGVTHLVDASAAVGAFLVGLAISGSTADRARTVLRPLRDLFAAMFFLSFGLEVAPSSLAPYLLPALALGVLSSLTKLVSGGYAAARSGVGRRGQFRAGSALVARGEFSIVIAGLAASAGYTEVGPLASAYVVLLGVAGPLVARFADRVPTERRRTQSGGRPAGPEGPDRTKDDDQPEDRPVA
ncbi:cation:proton antiporter [Nocardioides sp.]|uniref:cation:proton antiporter n=1 Tax=Nocardioides sp. TaxID=35761 RepID=UPI002734C9B6|nr:cation:proton antiporter [Nocardioides sp.]MDP3894995.1 cation:proton antiporter [Nocardioides sp.]